MATKSQSNVTPPKGPALKAACLREALEAIREKGVEALSLRDVARRLKVSHQAPYKHFTSKDHLLAEVIRECLYNFAEALRQSAWDSNGNKLSPTESMDNLGLAYLNYAAKNPLEYRLMFMTTWPETARTVGLSKDARASFDILCSRLAGIKDYSSPQQRDKDAMFVWSTIHGIASVLESEAMNYLSFDEETAREAVDHVRALIDHAIHAS